MEVKEAAFVHFVGFHGVETCSRSSRLSDFGAANA
jgi:hypothetical protein